ncbi:MAG: acyltransferase [Bulleidia sp.]|nr:acyltransferase [Bulleidia sp.]
MQIDKTTSNNIQILRGIAIIAVVMIHNTPYGTLQLIFRPFENFSVGLFLFLSGYLSHADQWHPWKRIRKILIPYVFWSAFYTLLYYHSALASDPYLILKHLITGGSAAIMYYVFVYCELTLLIPLIGRMSECKHPLLFLCISPLEILLLRTVPILMKIDLSSWFLTIQQLSCIGWFSYYFLGYLCGNDVLHIHLPRKKLTVCWVISILLQFLEGWYYDSMGIVDFGTQMKLSSFITDSIILLFSARFIVGNHKKDSVFHKLGNQSFGIFFLHLAVMALVTHFIGSFPKLFPLNAVITICITYAIIVSSERLFHGKLHILGL